ncbi:MAG: glycosyltransferase family 2 protein [Bacteroidales bacterium]|nr:glycosyltransferase family 2 protein [Bacteroidales bacterium]
MNPTFSILIPTWNNLPYLKLCIESLRKHSDFQHQIIVMVNEGKDGSLEWISSQSDLEYIASPNNIGICYGLNICRPIVKNQYIVYANDDMYFLPHWDSRLCLAIEQASTDDFMLSATMIEPRGDNPCCVIADFGDSIESFQEEALLQAAETLTRSDWSGSTWPPVLVPLALWDKAGGMSIEFSPGMYSDPDLSRKLWECGVRHFQGVGSSLVYHFGCKSTGRVKQNKGRRTFLLKWGITANQFMHDYLHIGDNFIAPLPDITLSGWKRFSRKIKQISSIIKGK